MPLIITFGVNGVGKDTLAKELKKRHPELELLNGSRIMLRSLGFDIGMDVGSPTPTRAMYKVLEDLPEETKLAMTDGVFKEGLVDFKNTSRSGILSSHLVIARKNRNNTIEFQKNLFREWFPEVFDGLVLIEASPESIIKRQGLDKTAGFRDRGDLTREMIVEQQNLAKLEWEKVKSRTKHESRLEIFNRDLKLAARQFEEFYLSLLNKDDEQKREPRAEGRL